MNKKFHMESLRYKVIKSDEQYNKYCEILEDLVFRDNPKYQDDIDLLTLLIEKWDDEQNTFTDLDPVELLKSLMESNSLKARDLTEILGLSKGTVSKILNYQKGFSKETIRRLSKNFRMRQDAFNRPYPLKSKVPGNFKSAS